MRWSRDRQVAWLTEGGDCRERIPLEEGVRLTKELGLPVPIAPPRSTTASSSKGHIRHFSTAGGGGGGGGDDEWARQDGNSTESTIDIDSLVPGSCGGGVEAAIVEKQGEDDESSLPPSFSATSMLSSEADASMDPATAALVAKLLQEDTRTISDTKGHPPGADDNATLEAAEMSRTAATSLHDPMEVEGVVLQTARGALRYSGPVDDLGRPHGHFGVAVFDCGDVYEGAFVDGLRHGHGNFRLASGQTYEGEFVRSKPHGHGAISYPDGSMRQGAFRNGRPHGPSVFYHGETGQVDIGECEAGEVIGSGVRWSASRHRAWYLTDGEVDGPMALDAAMDVTGQLGLSIPPPLFAFTDIKNGQGGH